MKKLPEIPDENLDNILNTMDMEVVLNSTNAMYENIKKVGYKEYVKILVEDSITEEHILEIIALMIKIYERCEEYEKCTFLLNEIE